MSELALLLSRTRSAVLLADDDRRFVDANRGACLLLRATKERLLARALDEWLPLEERDALAAAWAELLERGALASRMNMRVPPGQSETVDFAATAHVVPGRHLMILSSPTTGPAGASSEHAVNVVMSSREREVMQLVAAGETTPDMAERLFISEETVRRHVKNAMTKLDARTRAQAVAIAVRRGELAI
jgi:DNA-binding NarL/FixJ family response regulator